MKLINFLSLFPVLFLKMKPFDDKKDVKPARKALKVAEDVSNDNVKRHVMDVMVVLMELVAFVFEGYVNMFSSLIEKVTTLVFEGYVAMFSLLAGKGMTFRRLKRILRRGYKYKLWSSAGHRVKFIEVPLNLLKTDALMNDVSDIQNQSNSSRYEPIIVKSEEDKETHDSLELIDNTTNNTKELTDMYDVKITMSWVYGSCLSGEDLSLRELMGKQKDDEEVVVSKHGKNEIDQGIVEDLSDITLNSIEQIINSPVTITITDTAVVVVNDEMDWISLDDQSDESIITNDDSTDILPQSKCFRKRRLSKFLKRLNCFTSSKVKQ